ncbi:MAG TPA: hypothetical protein VMW92_06195 [Candidatus Heimdallarchaeota archaeon]|nr:hypothetical protein [Candidatus Heimdallarchaeota archaeon]
MRNLYSKQIIGSFFCWTLVFLILVLFSACKSSEKAEAEGKVEKEEKGVTEIVSVKKLIPIFGEATGTQSGISDLSQTHEELLISYHLYIADMSNFDEEIGSDLAPKIQKFYEEFKTLYRLAFRVYVPRSGEEPWRQYIFFVVTRKLIEQTEWTNLLAVEFLQVVEDLKYYD